jgi:AraC-like DNA-binding protein
MLWHVLTMQPKNPKRFQHDFFKNCAGAASVIELFYHLPQTYFYAKDRKSRFVAVNQLFLENHGLRGEEEAIGRTDRDFHPPAMAEAYLAEDRRVMESGSTLPGQTWLVLHRRRIPRWYVSTKAPIFDGKGRVIGLTGAMYRVEQPEQLAVHFQELLPVVTHIEKNFADNVSMSEMAERAGLSSTHFNRRFRQLLRMTPTQYLRIVRVQAARQRLVSSGDALAQIGAEVGFTDQSHFTRRFREVTGMTPAAYRQRFVSGH